MTGPSDGSEGALEPEIPIVDCHHHLWSDSQAHPDADPYSVQDLQRDISSGHRIAATVYLECSEAYRTHGPEHLRAVGETEWVMSQRKEGEAALAAMVAYADVRLGRRIGEVLSQHQEAAGNVLKGIRNSAAWDPSPDVPNTARQPPRGLLRMDETAAALGVMDDHGLHFETHVYFHQLDDVAYLASRRPDTQIVLCHLGGPLAIGPYANHRDQMREQWRTQLARVAEHENVALKLGGIGFWPYVEERLFRGPASSERLANYWRSDLEYCIETFRPDRCMFESNFPVDSRLCSYVVLWNTFKRATAALADSERARVFSETAYSVYRLDRKP